MEKKLKFKVKELIEGQAGLVSEIVKSKTKNMASHQSGHPGYSGFPVKYFGAESYL